MRFGLHVSAAGGAENAVARAERLGCDCFQLFVSNPRSWSDRRVEATEAERFRAARKRACLGPVAVHLTYLPNLASPDSATWEKSCAHLAAQYADAARLGADYFVVHPGSAKDGAKEAGRERAALALRRCLEKCAEGPTVLLENMSGAGSQIASAPEELAAVEALVGMPERVGVCFDTAHALAAGFDLRQPGGMAGTLAAYRKAFGRAPVRLVHLNDLRAKFASSHDRHEHLGRGSLGEAALRGILRTRGLGRMNFILETPVEREGDDARNLAAARRLAER